MDSLYERSHLPIIISSYWWLRKLAELFKFCLLMNKDILLSELCNPGNTRREGPLINLEEKGLSVLQKLYSQCRKLWNSVQFSAVN